MSIRVTFDSDESTTGFAAKHGLPTPTGNSLNVSFHLLEQATKDATVSVVAQTDETEHEFLVKGTQSAIELHATVVSDMGGGWFKVTSTAGAELAKVVDAIDVNSQPIEYLEVTSITTLNRTNSELDPLSAEGQWPRIRVASRYRPLLSSYSMHDTTAVSKPELYIMDSGIDFTHPEFDSASLTKEDFYTLPAFNGDYSDRLGHGTAVAAMAVGKNLGITTHCTLRNVKVGGFVDGAPYNANLIELSEAIDAILAEVTADPNKTRIVNMSLCIARSSFLDDRVLGLINAGVSVICAAGNSGQDVENVSPAGIDECITVGSTDKYDIPSGFNNISPGDSGLTVASGLSLDIFAPGENVLVAHPAQCLTQDGTLVDVGLYGETSGTSLASPIVAGIAVIVGAMNSGSVLYSEMKDTILGTSTKNALLFEDDVFSENQNALAYVFTADPSSTYKEAGMISYLGVNCGQDPEAEDIVADLNSSINITAFTTLYPDDAPVYSVHWDNAEIESKYSEYVNIMPDTGIITISPASGVTLPEATSLEQVQFIARVTTSRIVMQSTSIFYFNSNPDYADTESSDVTLALTDLNSISYFAAWSTNIK
jgi:hypothetical protein|tara:strand:+ start:695 stop:2485 length:1791 start_codon:yes stop_codon:yes gene_type:complete